MDATSILTLISLVLTFVTSVVGVKYQKFKACASDAIKIGEDLIKAAEDNQISEEEFQKLAADAKLFLADLKA